MKAYKFWDDIRIFGKATDIERALRKHGDLFDDIIRNSDTSDEVLKTIKTAFRASHIDMYEFDDVIANMTIHRKILLSYHRVRNYHPTRPRWHSVAVKPPERGFYPVHICSKYGWSTEDIEWNGIFWDTDGSYDKVIRWYGSTTK